MKYVTNIDLSKNELQNARIQNLATAPNNPVPGQMYFNTADKVLYVYTGTDWANALYVYLGVTFTSELKTKLDNIESGATKVADSVTNGNVLINGEEINVYSHPGSGTNPHGTTKSDVGLGNVENKNVATILDELTVAKIADKLGFTPRDIRVGADSSKGTATGSKVVYIATDTKKIWLDNASGTWIQVGGQDTIAWGSVTGKPATFTPPIASASVLGGVKIGTNLTITPDGTLNANDNPTNYLVKQQRFVAIEGQKDFTLTGGTYRPGLGMLSVFINGVKQSFSVVTETSSTLFSLKSGLSVGDVVLAEYVQLIDAEPYPVHATEHMSGGADPIPVATHSAAGLESPADKVKLDGIAVGAQVNTVTGVKGNAESSYRTGQINITASNIGLGSVDNTSDVNKPVSTSQKVALDLKLDKAIKGAANGLAELGSDGKVPAAQLPSYVDDVIEGYLYNGGFYSDSSHATVITGEAGKIYTDLSTNKVYRWSGSAYTIISDTIALGETSSTAYRGDHGKTAYNHSQAEHARTDATNVAESSTNGNVLINGSETNVYTHPGSGTNPHGTTKNDIGLGNVPNVSTNDQTPSYTAASKLTALISGETLSTAMGKVAKAISDLISHLADTTKHITAAERITWNARTKKYSTNVGDGSATEITVTHSLGTQDITVLVREVASPFNIVMCDMQVSSTNAIKLLFATAPSSGQYRVIVTG